MLRKADQFFDDFVQGMDVQEMFLIPFPLLIDTEDVAGMGCSDARNDSIGKACLINKNQKKFNLPFILVFSLDEFLEPFRIDQGLYCS